MDVIVTKLYYAVQCRGRKLSHLWKINTTFIPKKPFRALQRVTQVVMVRDEQVIECQYTVIMYLCYAHCYSQPSTNLSLVMDDKDDDLPVIRFGSGSTAPYGHCEKDDDLPEIRLCSGSIARYGHREKDDNLPVQLGSGSTAHYSHNGEDDDLPVVRFGSGSTARFGQKSQLYWMIHHKPRC